jgi:F-type H+-transporting ATPase subunit alpha
MSLYALTRGFLDDIPVGDVQRFEEEMLAWMDSNRADVLEQIRTTRQLQSDDVMGGAIEEFKKTFVVSE